MKMNPPVVRDWRLRRAERGCFSKERGVAMSPGSLPSWRRMLAAVDARTPRQAPTGLNDRGIAEDRAPWHRRLEEAGREGFMVRAGWTAMGGWISSSSHMALGL